MMLDQGMKAWIDSADYKQLLRKWRNAPSGNPFFQGETGKYYSEVMAKKRDAVGHDEAVAASKAIG